MRVTTEVRGLLLLGFYSAVGLAGDALLVVGGVQQDWAKFVVGLVIALGVVVMLSTGWWLRWQHTVEPDPRQNGNPY